jgi:hypothetical protein
MRYGFYSLAAVVSLCLSMACTLSGRSAENGSGPKSVQPENVADAASEAGAAQTRAGSLFRGTIGEAGIVLEIKRVGTDLTGTYYYLKSGSSNRLNLKGNITADGSFTMKETDASGKPTGEFKGKWKEDPNNAGASLEGEWLKPGQKNEGLGFFAWQQMVDFAAVQITTRELKETVTAKKGKLTGQYPELSGGSNVAGFNQLVKAKVDRSFSEFKKYLNGVTAEDVKQMTKMQMENYIEVSYDVEYADDDLISLSFNEDTFSGGAHPNHNTFTVTYDLKQGRELKLADLFKPEAKYLNVIADYSVKELKARKDPDSGESLGLLSDDLFADGAKPTADNYSSWNVTKKGLLITFAPYQVAAYAYGPQAVIIPVSALKDIVLPGGALAKAK